MKRYCKIIDRVPFFFVKCVCGKDCKFETTYATYAGRDITSYNEEGDMVFEDIEDFDVSGSGSCECGNVIHADGIHRFILKELIDKAIKEK